MSSSSHHRRNEYPPEQYPTTAEECWELGASWYSDWYALQDNIEQVERDFAAIRVRAEDAMRRINREVQGSQQQRALSRQYATVLGQYNTLKQTLNRNSWLKNSMKGLGKYMKRGGLVFKDDIPTFPLSWP